MKEGPVCRTRPGTVEDERHLAGTPAARVACRSREAPEKKMLASHHGMILLLVVCLQSLT